MKVYLPFLLAALLIGFLASAAQGQSLPEPRQSPVGVSRAMLGDAYVKVVYGRPYARDRKIFGSLVPHGEVWRTGANEATEITLTDDLNVSGKKLEAGTYSVFTIPESNQWTIIFNSKLGQWGSYSYNRDHDVLRVNVPVSQTPEPVDIFTISVEKEDETSGHIVLEWERTRIEVPLEK